ncbi:MAG: formate dehydrogenase accessory sulfurtransferase FdhD [Thermodesulfobacteriota bacterium]|nr:formate dehydrogenase accessory sulfurtransferase FdhD [Thermodesulfobacteriota bacterium]
MVAGENRDKDLADRDGLVQMDCRRYEDGSWRNLTDLIAPEVRVKLHWPGLDQRELWAFPDDLEFLALGHALLEFCGPGQIPVLDRRDDYEFFLFPGPSPAPAGEPAQISLEPKSVAARMAEFISRGGRWDRTGCFHRAALFHPEKETFVFMTEDIARHNCVDRAAGWRLGRGVSPHGFFLFLSARVTASLTAKIVRAGFRVVVSRSAVTEAAVETAEEHGLTLIGFAREGRFTLFTDRQGLVA